MTDPNPNDELPLTPKQMRSLRRTDDALILLAVCAVAATAWMVTHPPEPTALTAPVALYWVAAPPLRDAWALACTMGAAAATVLACHLDAAYPLVRWAARRLGRPEWGGEHRWWQGMVAPAVRQARLREAVLIAGLVGLALWHRGWDGLEMLPTVLVALFTIGLCGAGMIAAFSPARGLRAGLSLVVSFLAAQASFGATMWALGVVQGMP